MSAPRNDEELTEVKAVLRSLIISHGSLMTVNLLNKIYREEENENIPFRKFGYSTLQDFLQSIPDTVKLQYNNNQELCARHIDTEKSAHITTLISKQKKKPTKSRPKPFRAGYSYRPRGISSNGYSLRPAYNRSQQLSRTRTTSQPAHQQSSYRSQTDHYNSSYSHGTTRTAQQNQQAQQSWSSNDYPPLSILSRVLEKMKNSSKRVSMSHNLGLKKLDVLTEMKFCIDNNVSYTIQHLDSQLDELKNLVFVENDCIFFKDASNFQNHNDSKKANSNQVVNKVTNLSKFENDLIINNRTKIRLQKLLENHIEGIWCSELQSLYKSEYNLDLEYIDLGFHNITEFVGAFPDIFKVIQPVNTNRQMVLDARKSLSNPDTECKKKTLASTYNYDDFIDNDPDPVPIKLSACVSARLFPEGVLKLNESVDQLDVSLLLHEEYIEVNISEIFTPSFFWITLRKYNRKIRTMMDDLHDFYTNQDLDKYRIPQVVLTDGLNVACTYHKKWHRAIIKKVKPDGYIVVWFYDYGTVKTYNPNSLFYLHKRFSSLPAQAIACGLYNIKPINSTEWSRHSTNELVKKVWDVPLIAMISSIDEDTNSIIINLTDTNNPKEDVHISDWMVEKKLAEFGKMVCIRSSFLFERNKKLSQNKSILVSESFKSVDKDFDESIENDGMRDKRRFQSNNFSRKLDDKNLEVPLLKSNSFDTHVHKKKYNDNKDDDTYEANAPCRLLTTTRGKSLLNRLKKSINL